MRMSGLNRCNDDGGCLDITPVLPFEAPSAPTSTLAEADSAGEEQRTLTAPIDEVLTQTSMPFGKLPWPSPVGPLVQIRPPSKEAVLTSSSHAGETSGTKPWFVSRHRTPSPWA